MEPKEKTGPYAKARGLVESAGGRMKWISGGGPGGAWELELQGRVHRVPVRGDGETNDLDRLYVPEVEPPRTSEDYGSPGTLRDDAFWKLVGLFA